MSVLRVLLDHPDRRVATGSRLFVVLGLAVVAVTLLLATYGRNWAWTGFGATPAERAGHNRVMMDSHHGSRGVGP